MIEKSTRESLGEERVLLYNCTKKYGEISVKSFPFHNSQSLGYNDRIKFILMRKGKVNFQ